jgi:hypothetical protein
MEFGCIPIAGCINVFLEDTRERNQHHIRRMGDVMTEELKAIREKAIETVKAAFPNAYHTGHGTINKIISHKQPSEGPIKTLSDNLLISAAFDNEDIEYLDTALWVQAAAIVKRLPQYDLTKYL